MNPTTTNKTPFIDFLWSNFQNTGYFKIILIFDFIFLDKIYEVTR